MEKQKKSAKGRASGLVKALYVIAAILMLVWVYMIIVNIIYINNYTATYGISVSDMMMDSVQYVITGSISYFIYGVLVFCAGKIIRLLQSGGDGASETESRQISADGESAEAMQDSEIPASGKIDAFEDAAQVEAGDIPESEDAIEETEVIEDEDKK